MIRRNFYSALIRIIYLFGDLLLLNLAFLASSFIKFRKITPDEIELLINPYTILLLYLNVSWLLISYVTKNYSISRLDGYQEVFFKIVRSVIFHFLSLTALFVFFKTVYFSRVQIGLTFIFFAFSVMIWRILAIYLIRIYRERGYNLRNFVIIGFGPTGRALQEFFQYRPELGYDFKGYFDDKSRNEEILGKISDVKGFVVENNIDEIYCSLPEVDKYTLKELFAFADNNLVRVKILPDLGEFAKSPLTLETHGTIPVLLNREEPLENFFNRTLKRSFDIAFASLVIVALLSWLIPLMALVIKIDSRGPLFFFQKRSGRKGREFWCVKFRTMKVNHESHTKQATKNDVRVTKLGRFLRKTNLDELPQFLNVFMGHMSVVGPRPHMLAHTDYYSKKVDKYMVRHFVKPGITGLAQIKGYRGETHDIRSMINRVRMDIFYVENWSFYLDIKIIFLTMLKTIKGDGNAF